MSVADWLIVAWFVLVSNLVVLGIWEQERRIWDEYDRGGK